MDAALWRHPFEISIDSSGLNAKEKLFPIIPLLNIIDISWSNTDADMRSVGVKNILTMRG